jgi:hypothetical protein
MNQKENQSSIPKTDHSGSFYNTTAIVKVPQLNKTGDGGSSFLTLEDPHLIGTDE